MSIKQRTPEWIEARRLGVTATDIVAILGLSPYRSEGDVARSKQGIDEEHDEQTARRLRIGTALEDVIRAEDEVEHGHKLRRVNRLLYHPSIEWAMASLDFERRDGTIVEAKSTTRRLDGLPADWEAQVQWQMGVAGRKRAHIVCLRYGSQLECWDVDFNERDFDGMLVVAADFRDRLAAGGPFAESKSSINRIAADPAIEMIADETLETLVRDYLAAKAEAERAGDAKDAAALAIKSRMGPATRLLGAGWTATWKPNKPSMRTDWPQVAEAYRSLLARLSESHYVGTEEWSGVEALYTREEPGKRPLSVRLDKEAKQ